MGRLTKRLFSGDICIFQLLATFIIKEKCLFWNNIPVFIYFCLFFCIFWKILNWLIFNKMRQIDATFKPILAFLRHTYFKSKVTISVKMVLLELVHITHSKNASNAMLKKVRVSEIFFHFESIQFKVCIIV